MVNSEAERGGKKGSTNPRGLFLSYRRTDSKSPVNHLADDLRRYYGRDRVYLDLDSNRAGQDYIDQVKEALLATRVVIAVIGPTWVDAQDATGNARLQDPKDLVRRELEVALASGIAIVTILIDGAKPPAVGKLPDSLQPLAYIQTLPLTDDDWERDLRRLIETLERHGLYATEDEHGGSQAEDWSRQFVEVRKYERRIKASQQRAFGAIVSTVDRLGYKDRRVDVASSEVTFSAAGRTVAVTVTDLGMPAGYSTITITLPSISAKGIGAGAAGVLLATSFAGTPLLLGWPALRLWERTFAKTFLDNVEGVVEGRGVGKDSILPTEIADWLRGKRRL